MIGRDLGQGASVNSLHNSQSTQAAAFGITVSSHILTLRISQDEVLNCSTPAEGESDTRDGESESKGPLCYCLAVKDPLVEVYNSSTPLEGFKQYVGLMASDLSLYEMSTARAEKGGGRAESCQGARFFDTNPDLAPPDAYQMYGVPFIHRTSLETSWMTENVSLPTPVSGTSTSGVLSRSGIVDMNSVLSRSKHRALSVRVLVSEEPSTFMFSTVKEVSGINTSQMLSLKSTHVHITLRDMTYRFDPLSRWFNRIPELFSPPVTAEKPTDATEGSGGQITSVTEYGKTRLNISVQKLLVDFCQPKLATYIGAESRLLLSIGSLQLSSTLVSNSPRVSLNLGVCDVSIRIGNRLLRNRLLEQSPVDVDGRYIEEYAAESGAPSRNGIALDRGRQHELLDLPMDFDSFIDAHGIVTMGNIDHLDCRLDLNSTYKRPPFSPSRKVMVQEDEISQYVAVSFEATAGTCFFFGCADSLNLLTVRRGHMTT